MVYNSLAYCMNPVNGSLLDKSCRISHDLAQCTNLVSISLTNCPDYILNIPIPFMFKCSSAIKQSQVFESLVTLELGGYASFR